MAPIRLITARSLVRVDLVRLMRRALVSMGDLVSKGVISKSGSFAMMACNPRQKSTSCVCVFSTLSESCSGIVVVDVDVEVEVER